MMNRAKDAVSFLKSYLSGKKFFYRILIPFSLFCIFTICLTSWMIFQIIGKKYETQIRETNIQRLGQVKIFAEENLYNSLMQIINNKLLQGQGNTKLLDFFLQPDSLTVYDYYTYHQNLMDICNKYSYIKTVTLYRHSPSAMIDSRYGVSFDPKLQKDNINRFIPLDMYERTLATGKNMQFIPSSMSENTPRPMLTMLCAIPFYVNDLSDKKGYLSITIDEEKFIESVSNIYQFDGALMIFDRENRLLMSDATSKSWDLPEDSIVTLLTDHFVQHQNEQLEYGGTTYNVSWLLSPQSGWTYVSIVPMQTLNAEIEAVKKLVVVVSFAIVAVVTMLIHIITTHVYRPIKRLRAQTAILNNLSTQNDDIACIQDAVVYLTAQRDNMRKTIDSNLDILKYKALMSVLYDRGISEAELMERFELSGITFDQMHYCVMTIEIEEKIFYMLSIEQRAYITLQLQEFISNWFSAQIVQATEDHPANRIVALINTSTAMYAYLHSRMDELLAFIADNLPIHVNIVLSSLVDTLKEVNPAYKTAVSCLRYSFIYEYGNIFSIELCEQFDKKHLEVPKKEFNEAEEKLKLAHFAEVSAWLSDWEMRIYKENDSYQSVNSFVLDVYKLLFHTAKISKILEENDLKAEIAKKLKEAISLKDAMQVVYSVLQICQDSYGGTAANSDEQIIDRVLLYIKSNRHGELSLTNIAQHFKISPSHLSRVFKNVHGENISVFMINCKLEYAAELLISESELSITEISHSLGYYTPAYFTKLFKKRYGLTPMQYRRYANEEKERNTNE